MSAAKTGVAASAATAAANVSFFISPPTARSWIKIGTPIHDARTNKNKLTHSANWWS
jgi:hypothetical protein